MDFLFATPIKIDKGVLTAELFSGGVVEASMTLHSNIKEIPLDSFVLILEADVFSHTLLALGFFAKYKKEENSLEYIGDFSVISKESSLSFKAKQKISIDAKDVSMHTVLITKDMLDLLTELEKNKDVFEHIIQSKAYFLKAETHIHAGNNTPPTV